LHTVATPSRTARVAGRLLAALVALVAGLAAAFVIAPPTLAATGPADDLADQDRLTAAFRTAVVGYWRSGDRDYPPDLQRVVDYWFRFHLVKGGIAALLLIVLGVLTVVLWRTFVRARTGPVATHRPPSMPWSATSLATTRCWSLSRRSS
jgi:hypothetical protein